MKPAAPLTSNLLARKGEALPVDIFPAGLLHSDIKSNRGWNSHSAAKPVKKPAAYKKPGHRVDQAKDEAKGHEDHSDRVAMTLRLDPAQHRRLRIISVHSHQSAREIMAAALEIYLDHLETRLDITNCDCLNFPK
jgi:hypothetical protein